MQSSTLTPQEIDQVAGGAVPIEQPPIGTGPYNPFPIEDMK